MSANYERFIILAIMFLLVGSLAVFGKIQQFGSVTLSGENQDCAEQCNSKISLCWDASTKETTMLSPNIRLDAQGISTAQNYEKVFQDEIIDDPKGSGLILAPVEVGVKEPSYDVKPGGCQDYYVHITKDPELTTRWSWCILGFCLDPWWTGVSTSIGILPVGNDVGFTTNNNLTVVDLVGSNQTSSISGNISDWRISISQTATQNSLALFNLPMKANKAYAVNRTNLKVELLFDYASDNFTTKDTSGNNWNGTLNGNSTYNNSNGWDGNGAYSFKNVKDCTMCNGSGILIRDSNAIINILDVNLTISGWFKSESNNTQGTTRTIIGGSSTRIQFFQVDDTLRMQYANNTGIVTPVFISHKVNKGNWTFFTSTFNGTNQTLYLNGVLVNSTNVAMNETPAFISTIFMSIGRHPTIDTNGFNGSVDDVRIWNRTMSDTEIMDLYSNTGANKTILDYSTNTYSFILGNTTWNNTEGHDGLGGYIFTHTATTNGTGISISNSNIRSSTLQINLSMSAWIKPMSIKTSGQTTGTTQNANFIIGGFSSAGGLRYSLSQINNIFHAHTLNITGAVIAATASYTGVNAGSWTFIATTQNGTHLMLYINGILVNTTAIPNNGTYGTPAITDWGIGKNPIIDNSGFNGSMDNIILWNRTLTPAQVWALYNDRTNVLVSNELVERQYYRACVTPFISLVEGQTKCTANIVINTPPNLSSVKIISTSGMNFSTDNYSMNFNYSMPENSTYKNITSKWLIDNKSIILLNLPFEGGNSNLTRTKEYAYNNYANVSNAIWNITGGYDSKGAYGLNGVNSKIIISNDNITGNITNTTVTMWIYTKGNSSVDGTLCGIWANWDGATSNPRIGITSATNCLSPQLTYTNLAGTGLTGTATTIPINQWVFLTASFFINETNTSQLIGNLYTDAVLKNSFHFQYNGTRNSTGNYIGMQKTSFNRTFNGSVDDFILWNRTLSAEEIYALNFSRNNVLVANETVVGINVSGCGVVNDGYQDSQELCDGPVSVVDTSPPNITGATCLPNPSNVNSAVVCSVNVSTTKSFGTVNLVVTWPDGMMNTYSGLSIVGGFSRTITTSLTNGVVNYTWFVNDSTQLQSNITGNFTQQDISPPVINNVIPANLSLRFTSPISLSANISDNVNVSFVQINLTRPDGISVIIPWTLLSGSNMSGRWGSSYLTASFGIYNYSIWANDSSNLNSSGFGSFEFTANTNSWIGGIGIILGCIILSLAVLFMPAKSEDVVKEMKS